MAYAPSEPFILTGGCFCKAIRYTINVPQREDRPILPGAVDTRLPPLPGQHKHDDDRRSHPRVPTTFPLIGFDHCSDCRHAAGTVVQAWCISPHSWVEWTVLPLHKNDAGEGDVAKPPIHLTTLEACASDGKSSVCHETYISHYKSSRDVTRSFCSRCGTTLTYYFERPASSPISPLIDITMGSLDEESLEKIHPERQVWWDSGIGWMKGIMTWGDGGLMRHAKGTLTDEIASG
uniref:CENP-V/GFA domain-containing protein n=1 Tax=Coccidioides posadasii RMSCC 3488 TaxID=454284 RepID=A0A0J6F737_COCPO|nr:hypothetical protein CPAG_05110 [Coccidioides posadasii RMSCC 3488]